MSGGHFNYEQYKITEIADELEQVISDNSDHPYHQYPDDIIAEFETCLHHLRMGALMTQRIDWLLCDDDGEESFRKRLAQERLDYLSELDQKMGRYDESTN